MISRNTVECFKTYDIRGKIGEEINNEIAYRIGRATVESLKANNVVLGYDARETSPDLARALGNGVSDAGADVLEIGMVGTEEIYAGVCEFRADAGIEITASHNPIDYNGMKIVKQGSQPLSNKEFLHIKHLVKENKFTASNRSGLIKNKSTDARAKYIKKIIEFVDLTNLKPLKIVVNSGNGAAGPTIDVLEKKLNSKGVKTNFVYVNHEPDPSFPNGIPNPLLEENRASTVNSVINEKADFGVAFDGDFDRCFLFDHLGNFISGEYIVGLLSGIFLKRERGATIVHDSRVIWNTKDVIKKFGGRSVVSKTGHAFVKAKMRDVEAIYGGEMSAHHYFRDFAYCDSGMIPWMMIWELVSTSGFSLSDLISDQRSNFPSSGELNFEVLRPANCMETIKNLFAKEAVSVNEIDGLSMSFNNWRFNLRKSNTEPFIRLNIETRGDKTLLQKHIDRLEKLIKNS